MDDRTVFSTDDLPKRRLVVKATLATRSAINAEREIVILREQMVRQIAQKCVEHDDLVRIVPDGPFVSLTVDCIVLTTDELADLMRRQFHAGLEHARQFTRTWEPTAFTVQAGEVKP
jgi:hypothetical protein